MSTPPQHPAARTATQPAEATPARQAASPDGTERARIRWFVAGHVGAVTLLYLIATWAGDGWAPAPFPPDLTSAQRQHLLDAAARTPPLAPAADAPGSRTPAAPPSTDLAAPWHPSPAEAAR